MHHGNKFPTAPHGRTYGHTSIPADPRLTDSLVPTPFLSSAPGNKKPPPPPPPQIFVKFQQIGIKESAKPVSSSRTRKRDVENTNCAQRLWKKRKHRSSDGAASQLAARPAIPSPPAPCSSNPGWKIWKRKMDECIIHPFIHLMPGSCYKLRPRPTDRPSDERVPPAAV